ncbi:hypothetical protein L9F63_027689, partial [Diploptera punctata]
PSSAGAIVVVFGDMKRTLVECVNLIWLIYASSHGDIIIPCTELTVKDVWTTGFSKLTVESAVRLSDVNRDGALDVIIGHGT